MKRLSLLVLVGALPLAASAQTLYAEDFDANHTSGWNFNSPISGDTANNNSGNEANFFFDYSTVGIPSAPHSVGGSTTGLKLEANVVGTNVFTGASVSPIGQSFTGDYELSFDAWQNVIGPLPAGGSGSTQFLMGGIGSAPTTAQFIGGTFNGLGFSSESDTGVSVNYRGYNGNSTQIAASAFPNGQAYTATYYTSRFQGAIPAAQTALYSSQTGSPRAGTLAMAWHTWSLKKVGTTVTWSVDGALFATVTSNTLGGSDIFFSQYDSNATSSTDPNSRFLNFGLIDNVMVARVAPVPEPGAWAALGLGALAVVRRRRR